MIRAYFGSLSVAQDTGGIHTAEFDPETGAFAGLRRVAAVARPIWLEYAPATGLLYAAGEAKSERSVEEGFVFIFRVNPETGELVEERRIPSGGRTPCHLALHPAGDLLLCANYSGESISCVPLGADGLPAEQAAVFRHEGVGPKFDRQEKAHPHGVVFSPSARHAYAVDLGADRVFAYEVTRRPVRGLKRAPAFDICLAPGAGPRHLAFHPEGHAGYLLNELDSTLVAGRVGEKFGRFESFQTVSTLPEGVEEENYPAEVRTDSAGAFLYATNRGHDSIVIYPIDPASGRLGAPRWVSCGGAYPWDVRLVGGERWAVAVNLNSSGVSVFKRTGDGGLAVTEAGLELSKPASMVFLER